MPGSIVKDPERIKTLRELEIVLDKIKAYEKNIGVSTGVLLLQNRQLGAIYYVTSEAEAKRSIEHPGTCEWGIKFYPKSYFENKRSELSKEPRTNYAP